MPPAGLAELGAAQAGCAVMGGTCMHLGLFLFKMHWAIQVVRYLVFTSEFPRSEKTWKRLTFADILSVFFPMGIFLEKFY